MRPNSFQTLSAVLAGTGLVLILGSAAVGQGVSGGCQGSVNGSSPSRLTQDDPLVVGKGESISIQGTAPAGQTTGGSVNGAYSISIIEGIFKIDKRNQNWTGRGPNFRGNVNVKDYLKFGSGLYKVEGVATPGGGGWRCPASFYVRLDGSKIVGAVGAGIGAIGFGGTLAAARNKRKLAEYQPEQKAEESVPAARPSGETAEDMSKGFGKDFVGLTEEEMSNKKAKKKAPELNLDPLTNRGIDAGYACLVMIIAGLVIPRLMSRFLLPLAMAPGAGRSSTRIWITGRPVLGFFSGLIGGLGATIALQQFGFWPLTIASAIGFPVAIAILGSLRAWRGMAYKAQ